jgi:hypothetical protein
MWEGIAGSWPVNHPGPCTYSLSQPYSTLVAGPQVIVEGRYNPAYAWQSVDVNLCARSSLDSGATDRHYRGR